MTDETNELAWLDLVMYYGRQIHLGTVEEEGYWAGPQDERETFRSKRMAKFLRILKPSQDAEATFREFSGIVAGWFGALPAREKERHDPELITAIEAFNVLAPDHLVETTNDFLRRTEALPVLQQGIDRLEFAVPDTGFNGMTTAQWFRFATTNIRPVFQCDRCGLPFHPARNDARYHNASCRSAARKERREEAGE